MGLAQRRDLHSKLQSLRRFFFLFFTKTVLENKNKKPHCFAAKTIEDIAVQSPASGTQMWNNAGSENLATLNLLYHVNKLGLSALLNTYFNYKPFGNTRKEHFQGKSPP